MSSTTMHARTRTFLAMAGTPRAVLGQGEMASVRHQLPVNGRRQSFRTVSLVFRPVR